MTAKEILKEGNYSCVVIKDGEVKYSLNGIGIKPLLQLYKENLSDLEGIEIADKVIGKAAASILICAKVRYVYGAIMGKQALEILEQYEIKTEYGTLVENIKNKDNTGMCPLENLVKDIKEPEEAVQAIQMFVNKK